MQELEKQRESTLRARARGRASFGLASVPMPGLGCGVQRLCDVDYICRSQRETQEVKKARVSQRVAEGKQVGRETHNEQHCKRVLHDGSLARESDCQG
jgi:hypothetical protein